MQDKGLERKKKHDFPYNEIKKHSKKGVIMPMSLSHKLVKKHNKKLPANVTKNKILDFFGNQGTSSKIGKKTRKCGFVKRKGSFQPTKFAQAVITAVGRSDTPESLSKICELYNP